MVKLSKLKTLCQLSLYEISATFEVTKKQKKFFVTSSTLLSLFLASIFILLVQIYAVKFSKLPTHNLDKIIMMGFDAEYLHFDYNEYEALSRSQSNLDIFTGYQQLDSQVKIKSSKLKMKSIATDDQFFELFKPTLLIGRLFSKLDIKAQTAPIAIISFKIWNRYYDMDENILTRRITIDDIDHQIVGVVDEGFHFPVNNDVWTTLKQPIYENQRSQKNLTFLGKLTKFSKISDLTLEHESIRDRLRKINPQNSYEHKVKTTSFTEGIIKPFKVLINTVIIVLVVVLGGGLISLTNMFMLYFSQREKDNLIKRTLGYSYIKIAFSPFLQLSLIFIIASFLGIILSQIIIYYFSQHFVVLSEHSPFWWNINVGYGLYFFIALLLFSALLLLLLIPYFLKFIKHAVAKKKSLKIDRNKSRNVIVSRYVFILFQKVAASILVTFLVLALIQFYEQTIAYNGYKTTQILISSLDIKNDSYFSNDSMKNDRESLNILQAMVKKNNDVIELGFSSLLPGNGAYSPIEYRTSKTSGSLTEAKFYKPINQVITSVSIFDLLEVPLLEGRLFNTSDTYTSDKIGIVDSTTAQKLWPNQAAIGQRVILNPNTSHPELVTIIGVLDRVIWNNHLPETIFLSKEQFYIPINKLKVLIKLKPNKSSKELRKKLDIDSSWLYDLKSLDEIQNEHGKVTFKYIWNYLPASLIMFLLVLLSIKNTAELVIKEKELQIGVMLAIGFNNIKVIFYHMKGIFIVAILSVIFSVIICNQIITTLGYQLTFVSTSYNQIAILSFTISLFISIIGTLAAMFPFYRIFKLPVNRLLNN